MGIGEFVHSTRSVFDVVPLEFIGRHGVHRTVVTDGDRDGFGNGFFFVFVAGFAEVSGGSGIQDTIGGGSL